MNGAVRRFLGAAANRHRGRRTHALTAAQVATCNQLRDAVLQAKLADGDLARAAGCTRATIRGWLERQRYLSPRQQAGIRGVYSNETGGPG
jgi:hypothetical protein